MRVPYEWLRELVPVSDDAEALAERLSLCVLEVEEIERPLDGVVVGHLLETRPHPNADRLTLCSVDDGGEEPRAVVCGATNMKAGDRVALATPGTELPGGLVIKKSKIRGEKSEGMLCAPDELGLGDDYEGILILEGDASPGEPAAAALGLGSAVLEVALLPDRGDCASLFGLAREVASLYDLEAAAPDSKLSEEGGPVGEGVSVDVRDAGRCPRYMARRIRGVKVGPSPEWLARRLLSVGARPINNVVDVTNLILHELGQPLHAFDAAKVPGGRIVVRQAEPGEPLVLLDEQSIELGEDDLVIADEKRPIALAGVMGGLATAVSDATTDLILEAACFEPGTIRRSGRRHGLRTDSSYRFERGVDPEGVARALDRAAALLASLAGGVVDTGVIDLQAPAAPVAIAFRPSRVASFLGLDLDAGAIRERLERVYVSVEVGADGEAWTCRPPSWRWDLRQEADLLEEVVRLGGYAALPESLPVGAPAPPAASPVRAGLERTRDALRAEGYSECVNVAFQPAADLERLRFGEDDVRRSEAVPVANPIGEELALLRSSLWPGLLRGAARNLRHGVDGLRQFEIARSFSGRLAKGLPVERRLLAAVAVPSTAPGYWRAGEGADAADAHFFDAKHALLAATRAAGAASDAVRLDGGEAGGHLHPGASGAVFAGRTRVGELGRLHPEVAEAFELPPETVIFELDLDSLRGLAARPPTYRAAPKFPSVQRDLALLVPEDVSAEGVEVEIRRVAGGRLEGVTLFDRYVGKGIPAGQKSMAFRLTLRAADRTLQEKEINKITDKVVAALSRSLGAERR
ncbi:MAG: phenylalanine--tRNA ligase subunit beta [Deltaproteobacteria bacterium]|nr:phenylalanine--tRNA ligase subunit beta [Deltaproteobacteria bacterium]